MKTIKLYGDLGKKFGRVHRLDVRTPAEAVKALSVNFPEFKKYLLNNEGVGYRVLLNKEDRSTVEGLTLPIDTKSISFVPVLVGSGSKGGTILAGIVLIFVAWWAGPASLAAASAGTATGTATVTTAALINTVAFKVGVALVLSGVSAMLFKPPKPAARDAEKQITSNYFNGPVNLSTQGNPVPLAYGQVLAGSQVISAGIRTTKIPV